jgi:hypothetical protein
MKSIAMAIVLAAICMPSDPYYKQFWTPTKSSWRLECLIKFVWIIATLIMIFTEAVP